MQKVTHLNHTQSLERTRARQILHKILNKTDILNKLCSYIAGLGSS